MTPSRTCAALTLPLVVAALAFTPGSASAAGRPDTIALAAGSQPEGIAEGPGSRFFAGSRLDGAIYRGNIGTGTRTLLAPGSAGGGVRGLQLDRGTGLLWAAGEQRQDGGPTTALVLAYDSRTGEQVERIVVPGTRFLNDVQIVDGVVYVTDSLNPELVVVRDGAASLLPLTGDFRQPAGSTAINGIRELPDGALIVTDSSTGDLFRVDPATGVTDRIEIRGGDLASGDGLELKGRTLYVVYGPGSDGISVVRLDAGLRSGAITGAVTDPDLDRPTTAVLMYGSLYAVNGRFAVPPTPTTPYDVVRVRLD